ncbi:MAG: response regulator transcription factor [Oscillospiraceae bacterium]
MRVMIVEDQTMIRSLLESYFRVEDEYRITASIPGAKQAVEVCRTSSVDLILMDVQTENRENGLTAVRQIKAIQPKSKIIVVTSLIDCAVLDEAKRAGADSLWYKDSTQKRLMDVVRQTLAGEHVFPDAPPTVEIGMAKSTEFTKTELKVLRHLLRDCPTHALRQKWAVRCRRSNSMCQICCKKPGWKTSFSLRWQSATSS